MYQNGQMITFSTFQLKDSLHTSVQKLNRIFFPYSE